MNLHVLAKEDRLARIECSGTISLFDVQPNNPLVTKLGSDCFQNAILLDLGKTTAIDTAAVSWFIRCHESCRQAGGRLVLHSLPPTVEQILQLLRMHEVLHLAEDEQSARELARGTVS